MSDMELSGLLPNDQDDRSRALLQPLSVGIQQPRPEITGRAHQSIAAVRLVAGDAQADAGGAMHQRHVDGGRAHSELMFDRLSSSVKDAQARCG